MLSNPDQSRKQAMIRIILAAVLLTSFGQVAYGATTITGDITTNTTWNNAGSPYTLDPAGAAGGTITAKNATLTVDTSGGAVNIHWNEDCDFKIGDGSSQAGSLVIQASSGAVNFNLKTEEMFASRTMGNCSGRMPAALPVFESASVEIRGELSSSN